MNTKENYLNKGEVMKFKVEKNKPINKSNYRTPFTQALNDLEVGDTITGLSKVQVYKFRPNFYTPHFHDRKFRFWKDAETRDYCIQRTA